MSTDRDTWTAVDSYIDDSLLGSDAVLDDVLSACAVAGLPTIAVSPSQGKFLFILAKGIGAKRILELGTLGGYSGIWLARALPRDGRLVTLEVDPKHADVARRNFERAGVGSLVDVRIGRALDTLPQLAREQSAAFDFVFIDADKVTYHEYLEWAVRLCRPGAIIVADNVIRDGAVADATSDDPSVRGVRRFMERVGAMGGVTATAIQTVGVKGHDGLAVILVGTR
ncbi:MAG TPA: O-methyltransferase [Vicinamibacterales bacterium]|jgi:predicted O-methyltransferase YrrM|nr:O-methyltransferase [Vicinamibacterales bacterium]